MDGRVIRNKLDHLADSIKEGYGNGMTLREIAKLHGVAHGTVRNLLISHGVIRRSVGRRKK